jgi:hypothetical protein
VWDGLPQDTAQLSALAIMKNVKALFSLVKEFGLFPQIETSVKGHRSACERSSGRFCESTSFRVG